ncbi:SulP family inorganic anion transporter [Verrucomicrobia bacterium]|nr:SulP family inorganic anion transporter [Verrucomicrobiota bacterium]
MIFDLIRKRNGNWKDDTLSGLTVALALVPEAIAFSFIAGVGPLVGLWAAVFMGLITSAFGGRPGMISGSTGAIAIVVAVVVRVGNEHGMAIGVRDLGIQYLFAVMMIAGLIQVLFGVLRLGRFIRLVPHPVMMGFVNGLAIVILIGQFGFFKMPLMEDGVAVMENGRKVMTWMDQDRIIVMGTLAFLTMAIIHFLPKLTNAVPSILVAILVVGGISYSGVVDTKTISDVLYEGWDSRELSASLPVISLPTDIPWQKEGVLFLIIGTAFSAAMVGIIESLMTLQLIDDMLWTMAKYEDGPIAIRYPRGNGPGVSIKDRPELLTIGEAEVIQEGTDVCLIPLGTMMEVALETKEQLEGKGYSVTLINPRWIKPLDASTIKRSSANSKVVCTFEDHVLYNGFGLSIIELLHDEVINTPVERIGWPDEFIEHGKPEILRKKHGITSEAAIGKILPHLEVT